MVMMTNSLVLDCVIEFLCKHDQFEEKINVEKSFLEQIAALSQSSVEHILIHHRFGHFSGHELQIRDHDTAGKHSISHAQKYSKYA